jgi:hypothetical protein
VHSYELSIIMQFQPYPYVQTNVREQKLKISSRGITLKKKSNWTVTKFNFDLRNPMMYPYIKYELNVCYTSRDNERKLKISNFFFVQEG